MYGAGKAGERPCLRAGTQARNWGAQTAPNAPRLRNPTLPKDRALPSQELRPGPDFVEKGGRFERRLPSP